MPWMSCLLVQVEGYFLLDGRDNLVWHPNKRTLVMKAELRDSSGLDLNKRTLVMKAELEGPSGPDLGG